MEITYSLTTEEGKHFMCRVSGLIQDVRDVSPAPAGVNVTDGGRSVCGSLCGIHHPLQCTLVCSRALILPHWCMMGRYIPKVSKVESTEVHWPAQMGPPFQGCWVIPSGHIISSLLTQAFKAQSTMAVLCGIMHCQAGQTSALVKQLLLLIGAGMFISPFSKQ